MCVVDVLFFNFRLDSLHNDCGVAQKKKRKRSLKQAVKSFNDTSDNNCGHIDNLKKNQNLPAHTKKQKKSPEVVQSATEDDGRDTLTLHNIIVIKRSKRKSQHSLSSTHLES